MSKYQNENENDNNSDSGHDSIPQAVCSARMENINNQIANMNIRVISLISDKKEDHTKMMADFEAKIIAACSLQNAQWESKIKSSRNYTLGFIAASTFFLTIVLPLLYKFLGL
jgi:hypothetical protein